jgi:hypothetical protein
VKDDERLRQTLEHAATEVPYYRRRWGARWKRVRTARDLPLLPLLTKQEAATHQRELIAGRARAYAGVVSSGTVHDGPVFRVLHSEAEDDARDEDDGGPPRKPSRELVLEVRTVHHGLPDAPAPDGRLCVPWTDTRSGLRLIEQLLSEPQPDGRRVTALVIGASALAVLTTWLAEKNVKPSRFGVRAIGTYGFRLSPHWTSLIERAWRARVFDNYSLSELATAALQCGRCGFHHWGRPPVVFEVLDPKSLKPARRGVMVLTGLYPYVQAMPLIRYVTGDLVDLGPRCSLAKERGFTFRGRLSRSLLQPFVGEQDVSHFLDAWPEVARVPHAAHTLGLIKADLGPPKFELHDGKLIVTLRFSPHVFPGATDALRAKLKKRFGALDVRFAAAR